MSHRPIPEPERHFYRNRRSRDLLFLFGAVAIIALTWLISDRLGPSAASPKASSPTSAKASSDLPVRAASAPTVHARFKVVIDPGHGGYDPGAEGASGDEEKDFTLSLSQKVADLMRQEPETFEVHLTRTDDTFVDLAERPALANELGADAFLSIHGNTFVEDTSVSGTESFYYNDGSQELAEAVHQPLLEALGFRDRGVKKESLQVIRDSEVPAALVEVGFLTNPAEEAQLLQEETQDRAAEAIVKGLRRFLELRAGQQDSQP
ncbi:N-acetylmuramoyl-L-alanine amidase [Cohnella sp. REN36]|uniref:N-acetylmuramoyl-L-alanine amidase family protein n=1 Tax=Cohnella sp. REN36 TaxID=2887347 RepID=UPI001D15B6E9|nr:N-acetylmuramoyl-L-alanine amidase [Cohnella sp. REN36]MCC3376706.1 N-acetylmuramoyl-L-alanine amidase [Cohnella sp. REN36]